MQNVQNKVGAVQEWRKDEAKQQFLDAMARTNNQTASAEAAGLHRNTIGSWISQGYITTDELREAYARFQDYVRGEILKVTMVGMDTQIPVGGELVTVKRRDLRMLIELAKRHLPEWQQPEKIEVRHIGDVPDTFLLPFDIRKLLPEERAALEDIARAVEEREKQAVIDSTLVDTVRTEATSVGVPSSSESE